MNHHSGRHLLAAWMLVPAMLIAVQAMAASTADKELDEVLVNGIRIKPTRDPQAIVNWLKLLVGKFDYGGFVQLRGEGVSRDLLRVNGVADCTAFGRAPGVHCEINVLWPEKKGPNGEDLLGGASTLSPAMVEYGLDTDRLGIRYLQVDNKGLAYFGAAYLVANTLTTRMPCPEDPVDCVRTTRVTPHVDGKMVEIEVEIEKQLERKARQRFVLQRLDAVPEGAISGGGQ